MDDEMTLGAPTLRVRDLEGTLSFYKNGMGLQVKESYGDSHDGLDLVELGFKQTEEPLLILKHDPKAKLVSHDFAGLYHYALLLPDRRGLASTYLAIGESGKPFDGFADHSVSEALYLHDLERNGIEIYADRPRDEWPDWKGLLTAATRGSTRDFISLNRPLDFNSLLVELSAEERRDPISFPRGAKIGHIHLRVTDLARSVKFYHERLGLDIVGNLSSIGAAFLSVGGYHHHIGLNTWHSLGGSPHEGGEAGLENFRIVLPNIESFNALSAQFHELPVVDGELPISDPDGIRILITSKGRPEHRGAEAFEEDK